MSGEKRQSAPLVKSCKVVDAVLGAVASHVGHTQTLPRDAQALLFLDKFGMILGAVVAYLDAHIEEETAECTLTVTEKGTVERTRRHIAAFREDFFQQLSAVQGALLAKSEVSRQRVAEAPAGRRDGGWKAAAEAEGKRGNESAQEAADC